MKLMTNNNTIMAAVIIACCVQGCSGNSETNGSESDSPILNTTLKKSKGGEKLYRKVPTAEEMVAPQRSPSTDLEGGISGTGHDKEAQQGQSF